ncbi:MAG: hypothetical protein M1570_01815 [Chloroflexi bacterium]|nr:hypothetical protein [Chloroflexota bacterium]
MANSTDREAILEDIFKTSLYRRIEELLKERANKLSEAATKNREDRDSVFRDAGVQSLDDLVSKKDRLAETLSQQSVFPKSNWDKTAFN